MAVLALTGFSLAAPAVAASRFEGRTFVPDPADSAAFAEIAATKREADSLRVPGADARALQTARKPVYMRAESLVVALRDRLSARQPADSLAIGRTHVLHHDTRLPYAGLVRGATYPAIRSAAGILSRQLGPTHAAMIEVWDKLADAHSNMGQPRDAIAAYDRAIAACEAQSPPDTLSMAGELVNVADLRSQIGETARAEREARRALAIRRTALGPVAATATAHNQVGVVLSRAGRFREGLAHFDTVLAIRRRIYDPEHSNIAATLYQMATVRSQVGDLDSALALAREAVRIWELPRNNNNSNVGSGYSQIGTLLRTLGDYEASRVMLTKAVEIRRRSVAPTSGQLATALDNLAGLHEEMGDYRAAVPLREETLRIRSAATNDANGELAIALDNLARLRFTLREYADARVLSDSAIAVAERAFGRENPRLQVILNTRGDVLRRAGELDAALECYQRAERVAAQLSATNPRRATSLRRLGNLHLQRGDAAAAAVEFAKALEILEREFGPGNPFTADVTADLAHAKRLGGDRAEALRLALRAEDSGARQFALQSRTLSEREALRYATVRPTGRDVLLALAADQPGDATTARAAWNALIGSRTQVLDEMAERRRALRRREGPRADSLRGELGRASAALAGLLVRGASGDSTYESRLARAKQRVERAERVLGEQSRAFREEQARDRAGIADVERALPAGTAMVAYSRYTTVRGEGGPTRDDGLIAMVLPARGAAPVAVRVCGADAADSLADAWRAALHPASPAAANDLGPVRTSGEALRRAVWDPLAARLGEATRVLVVPAGELSLVPLAALPAEGERWLVETGVDLHLLASERDLIDAPTPGATRGSGRGLLAVGGAWFDSAGSASVPGELMAVAGTSTDTWRGPSATCGTFRDVRFAPLPATRAESQAVASAWNAARGAGPAHAPRNAELAIELSGADATEAAVKRLAPGRRVLHLATHGFFVDPDCGAAGTAGTRGIGGLAPSDTARRAEASDALTPEERASIAGDEHPLRLAGVALTGANRRGQVQGDADDGVLTAEELAALDLSGVEWAVLSACETGVGSVAGSEGVFGLRRALQIAGARTVLSSLWSVEDDSARRWMDALYRRRLLRGESTIASVNGAMRDELARRRTAGQSTHPFHWAGFVASGDWR